MKWLIRIKKFIQGLFRRKPILDVDYVDLAPAWAKIAYKEIGVKEVSGRGDNPRVVEYHKSTNMGESADSVPWCSSFVNWCFTQAGIKGTHKASARSWLKWGIKLDKPLPGCVVVFWRGSKESWQGHVAFYVGENKHYISVLGGNQHDEVCLQNYHKDKVLGYRWPK
jgi:uncharacterized protein (TIGR02594 family)